MRRPRHQPRYYNSAPRQMIDEAEIRRIQTTDPHGTVGGQQLTGSRASRTAVDGALYNVNGN